jgi:hypothetical protein
MVSPQAASNSCGPHADPAASISARFARNQKYPAGAADWPPEGEPAGTPGHPLPNLAQGVGTRHRATDASRFFCFSRNIVRARSTRRRPVRRESARERSFMDPTAVLRLGRPRRRPMPLSGPPQSRRRSGRSGWNPDLALRSNTHLRCASSARSHHAETCRLGPAPTRLFIPSGQLSKIIRRPSGRRRGERAGGSASGTGMREGCEQCR